jgi:hypothetical protein
VTNPALAPLDLHVDSHFWCGARGTAREPLRAVVLSGPAAFEPAADRGSHPGIADVAGYGQRQAP